MEIEAKYSILDERTYRALEHLPHLAGFAVTEGETHHLHDEYLDTTAHHLLAAGYACRKRSEAGRFTLALKSLGTADGSVHRREEIKWATREDPGAAPGRWADNPLRDRLLDLIGERTLIPLFALEQERHLHLLRSDDGRVVAEFALDRVCVGAGEVSQRFIELEVELIKEGGEQDLNRIVTALGEIAGLAPQPTSKFERALAFVSRKTDVRDVRHHTICPDDTLGYAMGVILAPLFIRMQEHEQGTYAGEDPEELHDMRVATRRMRTALWIAKPYLDRKAIARVRKGLKKTAKVLGAVRDMDVFREKTEHYLASLGYEPVSLSPLMEIWNVEYTRRRNRMLAYLSSKRYARFKKDGWTQIQAGFPEIPEPHRLRDILPVIIRQRLDKVVARGAPIDQEDLTPEDYHRLRIDVKRLRYTLEFFREALEPEAGEAIEALKVLQDYFGDLQDAVVASAHIRAACDFGTWELPQQPDRHWVADDGDAASNDRREGLVRYYDARHGEIATLVDGAVEIWEQFEATGAPSIIESAAAALPAA
jgi:CHAD domain-containing protein